MKDLLCHSLQLPPRIRPPPQGEANPGYGEDSDRGQARREQASEFPQGTSKFSWPTIKTWILKHKLQTVIQQRFTSKRTSVAPSRTDLH